MKFLYVTLAKDLSGRPTRIRGECPFCDREHIHVRDPGATGPDFGVQAAPCNKGYYHMIVRSN